MVCFCSEISFQRCPTRTLFYSNFQGFKHCSIFHFQGSCCCCSQRQRSISYHIIFALSTTFLNFFLNLFRFVLLFSAACYILPDVHAFVNCILFFLFYPYAVFRGGVILYHFTAGLSTVFPNFILFYRKKGAANASMHPKPLLHTIFPYKKPFKMRMNNQLNKLF